MIVVFTTETFKQKQWIEYLQVLVIDIGDLEGGYRPIYLSYFVWTLYNIWSDNFRVYYCKKFGSYQYVETSMT